MEDVMNTPSYPLPVDAARRGQNPVKKWHRRKRERPAEILAAAVAELSSKEFQAVRMVDIARRAGVSKGTIYLYFRSKAELFKCLGLEPKTTD